MFNSNFRSVKPFAAGLAVAVIAAATFVGVTGQAASGGGEASFVPMTPCRLFDTRPAQAVGSRATPLGPDEAHVQQVTGDNGQCSIPADATGVAMNVTIAGPTQNSHLRIYPADVATAPQVSSLNWVAGQAATPNKVDVSLSATGSIKLHNFQGQVHVLGDVVGYYTPSKLDALAAQVANMRNQTVRFSGVGAAVFGADTAIANQSGCTRSIGMTMLELPLEVPVGATVTNVTANVFDASVPTTYEVELIRRSVVANGGSISHLTTATGGQANATVAHDLTPSDPVVMGANSTLSVTLDTLSGITTNALCSVSVSYQLPG
jgi:hypothetical protein